MLDFDALMKPNTHRTAPRTRGGRFVRSVGRFGLSCRIALCLVSGPLPAFALEPAPEGLDPREIARQADAQLRSRQAREAYVVSRHSSSCSAFSL